MHNNTDTSVTVIGLGRMGRSLADTFLRAGHRTTVWNRTPSRAADLVARGAGTAADVETALRSSALTIICLTDYGAVRDALGALSLRGVTLINLTSGDSAQARETAEWAAARGASYLDGAIMAIPQSIGTDDAEILFSGAETVFEEHRATLAALGTATYLGADHGLSALYDVAGLAMMWSVLNAWLHGTAMLGGAQVDAADFAPFARRIAAGVADWLPGYAAQIDDGDFTATVSSLETDAAAMAHLVAESERLGVNTALPLLLQTTAARAIAAGHGAEAYPALIDEFRTPR